MCTDQGERTMCTDQGERTMCTDLKPSSSTADTKTALSAILLVTSAITSRPLRGLQLVIIIYCLEHTLKMST